MDTKVYSKDEMKLTSAAKPNLSINEILDDFAALLLEYSLNGLVPSNPIEY